jgi:ABC-type Fe3+/spermidine/putrescine transport system ATPase subunit
MYKFSINQEIKKALVFFAFILLSMITMVTASEIYKSNANDKNARTVGEMRSWKNKIEAANKNNQILVQHEDTFKELKDKYVIGDENRLSWVEVVQKVADSRRISSVKYNIASQVLLDKDILDKKYTGIDVFKSVMSLEMKFIHEGDLFVMLNALRDEAKGLVAVDKCDVELINKDVNDGIIGQNITDNMSAYCELSWYTLKKAEKG